MLVYTMSSKEIQDEIIKDYHILTNSSTLERLAYEYASIRKKNRISTKEVYPYIFEIRSKSKNPWMIQFRKKDETYNYLSAEDGITIVLTYYQSTKGIRVFITTPSGLIKVYNAHFFNRYQERLNLPNMPILELVKKFINTNLDFMHRLYKKNDEDRTYFTDIFSEGIAMGHLELEEPNVVWFVNNTFLPNHMLSEQQWEGKDHLTYLIAKKITELPEPNNLDAKLWSMAHAVEILKDGKVAVDLQKIITYYDSKYQDTSWDQILLLG